MSRVAPFYSDEPGRKVYHNNNQCTEGNNIEARNWRSGTGNKRLCERCKELNAQGR
jgi:hypothetical protein